jgi:Ca2+-binding EF-hand superfamily protein
MEIETAFYMFDSDRSNTIDMFELKDAMKALGINMNKTELHEIMERIDKDGSGQLECPEFVALMSEIMYKRN